MGGFWMALDFSSNILQQPFDTFCIKFGQFDYRRGKGTWAKKRKEFSEKKISCLS